MKTKVLDFIKQQPESVTERFNQAMALASTSGISPQLLQRYNRKGATADNVENILYDLKKHLEISAIDVEQHTLPEVQPELEDNFSQIRTVADFTEEQLDPFNKILREMNDTEKSGFKFREQYPFLREENVPNEFKVLTADAITAFENFKAAHEELFAGLVNVAEPQLTNEEVFAIAKQLLADFEENREIHAELEHYQKTKEILGNHEIFAELKLQREIEAIPAEKLGQEKANVASRISKKKNAIEKEKDPSHKLILKGELKALEDYKNRIVARIEAAADVDKK